MGKRKKEKSEEVEWKQGRDRWVKEYRGRRRGKRKKRIYTYYYNICM